MSKRHQSSRRKSYGRRQHEVRERHDRASITPRRPTSNSSDGGRRRRPTRSHSSIRARRDCASRSATEMAVYRGHARATIALPGGPRASPDRAGAALPRRRARGRGPGATRPVGGSRSSSAASSWRSCSRSSRSPSRSACPRRATTSAGSRRSAIRSTPAPGTAVGPQPARPRARRPQARPRRRAGPARRPVVVPAR